jgi:hypothetical protein
MLSFRVALLLTMLCCGLPRTFAADLPAQYTGTVTFDKIEIRAAPAWAAPQTMFLKKGQQVAIHHEEGGFYAIIPPAGSVSWVSHLFLGEYDPQAQGKRNAVIKKDNCPVLVGSEIEVATEGKDSFVTNVRQLRLPYGSIVDIVGPKYSSNDTYWYPITPPAGEYRYIAKHAIGNLQPVNAPTAVAKPNGSGVVSGEPTTPNQPNALSSTNSGLNANSAKVAHPLWGEAELLQSQGRYPEASKVYLQIYQELKDKRSELEDLLTCLNRIDECKEKAKSPNGGNSFPREAPPRNPSPASLENPSRTQPAPPMNRRDWPTNRPEEKVETNTSFNAEGNLKSSGSGILRRAPFFIDNKQAYALQTNNGELLYYVTAGQGLNLDGQIAKRVELLGKVEVRGDLRGAPYMIVTKILPAK